MTGLLPRWPDSWQSEVIVFSSNTSLVSWISSMPSISSSSVDLSLADPYSTAPNGWGEFSAVIVTVERANPGKLLTHRTSGECSSGTVMSLPSNSTALRSPLLTEEGDDDGDCRKNKNLRSRFDVLFWVCDLLLGLLSPEDGTCWMFVPLSSFSKERALKVCEVTGETLNSFLFISQFGASSIWQANGINQDLIALLWWSFQCGIFENEHSRIRDGQLSVIVHKRQLIGALWKINLGSHFDQSESTKIGKLRLIKVN